LIVAGGAENLVASRLGFVERKRLACLRRPGLFVSGCLVMGSDSAAECSTRAAATAAKACELRFSAALADKVGTPMAKYRIAWMPGDGVGQRCHGGGAHRLDRLKLDAEYVPCDIGWEFWCKEGNALAGSHGESAQGNDLRSVRRHHQQATI
jgi:hypothetical protein